MIYDSSLKDLIISRSTELLERDRSGKGYICPLCNSGSGPKGTGLTTKDGIHFTCFAGCFKWADIIDIMGLHYGISDYPAKLEKCADLLGIRAEDYKRESYSQRLQIIPKGKAAAPAKEKAAQKEQDFTAYLSSCAANVEQAADYLESRGISLETAKRFNLGCGDNPVYSGWHNALIIPTGNGKNNYTARNTDKNSEDRYRNGGHAALFNQRALYESDQPVFIVEGELDAISIYEAGGVAVGLGSIDNANLLLKLLEANRPKATLLLALDNDENQKGQIAEEKLAADLANLKIKYYRTQIYGEAKDANDALVKDRQAFTAAVEDAKQIEEREREAEKEEYLRQNRIDNALQSFVDRILSGNTPRPIPTGFKQLDAVLDGGLYPSLITLGAVTGLGKTAFTMQVADQMAAAGKDVLVIALEMSREELMARSISRETILEVLHSGGDTRDAKTCRYIMDGFRYPSYSQTEQALIQKAFTRYEAYADHLYVLEGVGNLGVKEIRQAVERHIAFTGKAPVVIVDYMQIIAPADPRATDKQNTDTAILNFKRMSRDLNTPVICISSLNRDSYNNEIQLKALKESGAIEYGSDIVIGLQLKEGTEDNAVPRQVEAKILKNRAGKSRMTVTFDYYPMFNYYAEQEG